MTSKNPNASCPSDAVPGDAAHKTQSSLAASAATEKSALDLSLFSLIEAVVDDANIERAWKNVKANKGAPGPDGITLDDFFETFRHHWPEVRRQLLEGTYRPGPSRRKSIPKPDGGTRDLGIPNVIDRLIQQSILQVLTPIFDPGFSESSFGFRPKRSAHGAAKQIQQTIRSGFRWCVDMERYLTGTLKLVVNRDKSRVCRTAGVEFLGYQFHGFGGQIRVSPKSLKKFKQRAKEILTRNRGISMRQRFRELRLYLRGWIDYFVLEQRKSTTLTLDKWLRRRVRACYWSNWRLPRTRLKKLQALGVSYDEAYPPAHSGKGPWRLSMTSGVQRAMTNAWLQSQGLFTLEERWSGLAPKRRTA